MSSFGGILQPIGTVGVQGETGEDVRLGNPTDGDPNDGLITLDPLASVVDTIDALNEAAKTVDDKDGAAIQVGAPSDGDYTDGQQPITPTDSVANAVDALNVGLKNANDAIAGLLDRVGWTRVADVVVPGGTATGKTYLDPPNNTVLQTVTVSSGSFEVIVEAAYPTVEVNGSPAVLPLVGSIYRGNVPVTLGVAGPVVVESFDGDGNPGAQDTIDVTLDLPPNITAATFTGGYPGAQTELKEDDTFQLQVTADKSFDTVEIADFGAGKAASIPVTPGTSATVTLTVADRGDVAQALGARLTVLDTVTAAPSPSFDTDSAGSADGVNVVSLNNLGPTVALGAETYPGGQSALKGAESATVGATQSDFDTITYDDNGTGQLTVTNPTTAEASKTVTRAGGSYNVEGDGGVANLRVTATRAANDKVASATAIVNIANVAATVTVSEATARVRSGPAPGNDTTITISADQQLFSAPSLDPSPGRGTFQGGGFVGGPKTWTRALRVPDSENPATGATNAWLNLSATNLAGIPTTVISGNDTYVIGGFTPRTLNFAAFTANSAETVPLTDQSKLAAGAFSNGNPAVVQPAGTADTTDVGKEGWVAPLAAAGVSVGLRMLHSPTVAANSGGLTLTLVEETV